MAEGRHGLLTSKPQGKAAHDEQMVWSLSSRLPLETWSFFLPSFCVPPPPQINNASEAIDAAEDIVTITLAGHNGKSGLVSDAEGRALSLSWQESRGL